MAVHTTEIKLRKAELELESCTDPDRQDELERLIDSYRRELAKSEIRAGRKNSEKEKEKEHGDEENEEIL